MSDVGRPAEPGPDGRLRCPWALRTPEYLGYHDHEWGRPVRSGQGIFERLCLEGFQSGLSWLTILRKRENFRTAFAGFDLATVAPDEPKGPQGAFDTHGWWAEQAEQQEAARHDQPRRQASAEQEGDSMAAAEEQGR